MEILHKKELGTYSNVQAWFFCFAFLTTTYFDKMDIIYFASFLLHIEECSAISFFLPVQWGKTGYSTAH